MRKLVYNMALAYEMNTDLAFDTEVMRSCASRYGDVAETLEGLAMDLDNCLSELKDKGWTTPAGTAFYEMVNTDWIENIKKIVNLLNTLDKILVNSATKYDALVSNEINYLKLQ